MVTAPAEHQEWAPVSLKRGPIRVRFMPRQTFPSFETFALWTPPMSVALDGVVPGGPAFDASSHHVNFDHHDGVVREATMSTAMTPTRIPASPSGC